MKQIFMDFSGHFMWFVTIREMLHFVYRSFFYSIISGEKVIFGPQYITVHMDHFQDKTFHNNDDKLMTFIFFNEVFFFLFISPFSQTVHQQPITQQRSKCMWWMHGTGPFHSQQLRLAKLSARKLTKTKKLNRSKVTPLCFFGNSSPTWSLTKDRPALGAKCVANH